MVWVWLITKLDDAISLMTLQVRHMHVVANRDIRSSSTVAYLA